jgi:general secretion pathway protein D
MTAKSQTMLQILERIAKQVDIRYESHGSVVSVMPDKPFLKTYKIDFINIDRTSNSVNTTTAAISGSNTATAENKTTVTTKTVNKLMESLMNNVKAMLIDEDQLHFNEQVDLQNMQNIRARGDGMASGSSQIAAASGKQNNQASDGGQINNRSTGSGTSVSGSGNQDIQGQGEVSAKKGDYVRAVNVFANNETGVLVVRATSRQHEKVQEFIDMVMRAAKRQVLIEATIVEVTLSSQYQQGISWSQVFSGPQGWKLSQAGNATFAATAGALAINANPSTSINLLQTFGTVKVLSSPKLTVMNNQTASLKVAKNSVYFTISATAATTSNGVTTPGTYTTTPNSVSVGLTMSVTPQISDSDSVTLNVRPSISSIVGTVNDPNPILTNPCGTGGTITKCDIPAVTSTVPVIQTREMESIIKIENGQTAVMGGLIQEGIDKTAGKYHSWDAFHFLAICSVIVTTPPPKPN